MTHFGKICFCAGNFGGSGLGVAVGVRAVVVLVFRIPTKQDCQVFVFKPSSIEA